MKTITKSECLALIERLADKTLSFGCEVEVGGFKFEIYGKTGDYIRLTCHNGSHTRWPSKTLFTKEGKILGHPVMLGDVLKAMRMKSYDLPKDRKGYALKILHHFQRCGGEDLSLQEILEGAEESFVRKHVDGYYPGDEINVEIITGKEAELFIFLNEIL